MRQLTFPTGPVFGRDGAIEPGAILLAYDPQSDVLKEWYTDYRWHDSAHLAGVVHVGSDGRIPETYLGDGLYRIRLFRPTRPGATVPDSLADFPTENDDWQEIATWLEDGSEGGAGGAGGSKTVETVAELEDVSADDAEWVQVRGYHTGGDCPTRWFRFSSEPGLASDAGSVFLTRGTTDSQDSHWVLAPQQIIDARWFGVFADGTDVTTNMLRFSEYCAEHTTAEAFIPGATEPYQVSPVNDGELTFYDLRCGFSEGRKVQFRVAQPGSRHGFVLKVYGRFWNAAKERLDASAGTRKAFVDLRHSLTRMDSRWNGSGNEAFLYAGNASGVWIADAETVSYTGEGVGPYRIPISGHGQIALIGGVLKVKGDFPDTVRCGFPPVASCGRLDVEGQIFASSFIGSFSQQLTGVWKGLQRAQTLIVNCDIEISLSDGPTLGWGTTNIVQRGKNQIVFRYSFPENQLHVAPITDFEAGTVEGDKLFRSTAYTETAEGTQFTEFYYPRPKYRGFSMRLYDGSVDRRMFEGCDPNYVDLKNLDGLGHTITFCTRNPSPWWDRVTLRNWTVCGIVTRAFAIIGCDCTQTTSSQVHRFESSTGSRVVAKQMIHSTVNSAFFYHDGVVQDCAVSVINITAGEDPVNGILLSVHDSSINEIFLNRNSAGHAVIQKLDISDNILLNLESYRGILFEDNDPTELYPTAETQVFYVAPIPEFHGVTEYASTVKQNEAFLYPLSERAESDGDDQHYTNPHWKYWNVMKGGDKVLYKLVRF